MIKFIKIALTCLLALFVNLTGAQVTCDNGGFEESPNHLNNHTFKVYQDPDKTFNSGCFTSNSETNYLSYSPSGTDNFTAPATLVSPGNDLFLNSTYGLPNVARVHNGNYAVRLEGRSGGYEVSKMKRTVTVDANSFNFSFSLILQHSNKASHVPNTTDHPHGRQSFFKARLKTSSGVVVDSICIVANLEDCFLNQLHNAEDYLPAGEETTTLYTGWVCGRLNTTGHIDEVLTVEYTVEGCRDNSLHRAIVYIDDQCSTCNDEDLYTNCCKPDLTAVGLIAPGFNQQEERSQWIKSTNTILSNAKAIYHAGDYVEMNPGFEAASGSQFAVYIESCSNSYVYRPSQDMEEPLPAQSNGIRIYPNPSHSLITLSYEAADLKSITITGMDGKRILARPANSREMQIDVSGFSNGIYLVTVETSEGKILNSKFVKN
ncbi:T9SS type A sorting domain-containing protein [Flavobacterium sp.]|uniref:T9SS type A sorting domain-containing protein n=1 Tax=Flavobacterium sp. TaxID=239 RepID=UPI0026024234|nr:T9SS type A sorting domain-containing protein [Flavobacterium sp.]